MKNSGLIKFGVTLFIISIILLVVILAKNILIPLALGTLFAYLFYPIAQRLENWRVHRILATFTVVISSLVIFGIIIFYFSVQISNIRIDLEGLKEKMVEESGSPEKVLERRFGVDMQTMDYYLERVFSRLSSTMAEGSVNIFSATATTLFQIFILPVFIFFILFYRTKTAWFILRVAGRKNRPLTIKILKEVKSVTTRYLGGLLGVVAILAVLNSTGLAIIGVPHAIVLGVGAALLNLIPYFGTLLGALIPLVYVIVTIPDPLNMLIKVVVMFIIVQFLENNIITPNVVGGNVRLNALTIIVGLLIGNLIWGIAGMLVVIPFIAILKIIMRNIDSLKPFAHLLSSKGLENHSLHGGYMIKSARIRTKYLWRKRKQKKH